MSSKLIYRDYIDNMVFSVLILVQMALKDCDQDGTWYQTSFEFLWYPWFLKRFTIISKYTNILNFYYTAVDDPNACLCSSLGRPVPRINQDSILNNTLIFPYY